MEYNFRTYIVFAQRWDCRLFFRTQKQPRISLWILRIESEAKIAQKKKKKRKKTKRWKKKLFNLY